MCRVGLPPDFATFWWQAAQQGYTKKINIAQVSKTALFRSEVEALGSLGDNIASSAYWHRDFPYASSLTGVGSRALADGYERESGKHWNQQLGASLSLFDAGFQALKNSAAPKDKAAVVKALATLKTVTIVGKVDFTSAPFPNVSPRECRLNAMGEIETGQQIPVRIRHHRTRKRSEGSDYGETLALRVIRLHYGSAPPIRRATR